MKIAPIDISHKTFSKKMMGLDPEEVQDFLRSVADEMESVLLERNRLKEAMREKELQLMEYRERDEILKNTIKTATVMAEKMREDSERESKLVVREAEAKGEIIIADARDSLKKTYEEISELKRIKMQMESHLHGVIAAHKNLLEQSSQGLTRTRMDSVPSPSIDEGISFSESDNHGDNHGDGHADDDMVFGSINDSQTGFQSEISTGVVPTV